MQIDVFPYEQPSPEQEALITQIIKDYNKFDIFLINAPVAFGKSAVAKAIMNIANTKGKKANWIVPNNALVSQVMDEFKLDTLQRKAAYENTASFLAAKSKAADADQTVLNYWSLLANKTYKHTLCVDECHSLITMLQDFEGVKYWETSEDFPLHLGSVSEAILWLASRQHWDKKAAKMLKTLEKNPKMYTLAYEWGMYREEHTRCFRVYPLSPRNNAPILWPPSRTKKIFLMSATTSVEDLYELGLGDRRWKVYEAPSSIPPKNRPAIYYPLGSMSYAHAHETVDKVVNFILECAANEKGKGFIHATYNVAARLKARLGDNDRIMFHTKWNKKSSFQQWVESEDGIFVGSGMTEGINLKGKLARWQIITKCPFPNLKDPAISAKKKLHEKWYQWVTIRDILQAYGRVCRGPNDYGKTYIVDSAFGRLYNSNIELFPEWFKEALR